MACDHMRHVEPTWVKETCSWTGEDISRWEYNEPESTFVDRVHILICVPNARKFFITVAVLQKLQNQAPTQTRMEYGLKH